MTKYDDELPEWSWPYTDSYTGPNWSDAKWQASVAGGKSKPQTKLDTLSQRHDSVYALDSTDAGRDASDLAYFQGTRGMSYAPRIFGDAVLIGNAIGRRSMKNLSFGNMFSVAADIASFSNPIALIGTAANFDYGLKTDKGLKPANPRFRGNVEEPDVCEAPVPITTSIIGKPPGWRPPEATSNFQNHVGSPVMTPNGLADAGDSPGKHVDGLQRDADGRLNAPQRYAAFYQFNINERLDRFHRKLYKNKRRRKTRVYCC